MKISPISQGTGTPGAAIGQVTTGRTDPNRIAAAKAIAAGETPIRVEPSERNEDPQIARIKKIKMRTQASPERFEAQIDDLSSANISEDSAEPQTQSATPDVVEQQATEETKPLSPQFAALARQKRALQVKEREIQAREEALKAQATQDGARLDVERLKADPLSVLDEAGILNETFYNALADRLASDPSSAKIRALEAKIAALETGVDKKLTDRESLQEQQALAEMRREADRYVASGDEFKYTRAMKHTPKAIDLIHRTYKETGEILDVHEALGLIEAESRKEYEALSSQLTPAEQAAQDQQQIQRPQGMRTLTNRDGARPQMSRRERAIAAMNGTLKR